jgi:hypothetical protein
MKRIVNTTICLTVIILGFAWHPAFGKASEQSMFWPTPKMAAVYETVISWGDAWSQQDVGAYLGHYAPEFQARLGANRTEWEQERSVRITNPRYIRIEMKDIDIELLDGNHAVVYFTQVYDSNSYRDVSRKMLRVRLCKDGWQIVSEITKTDDTWS